MVTYIYVQSRWSQLTLAIEDFCLHLFPLHQPRRTLKCLTITVCYCREKGAMREV